MVISLFITGTSKQAQKVTILDLVSCVHNLNLFKKDEVGALIDLGNDVNTMIPAFAAKLGFKIYSTNVKAQKIDGFFLKMFAIVLGSFQVGDKLDQLQVFEKLFLLADTSI